MNLAAYQEWRGTYWANDPDGQPTAEMLHALFSMDERVAFLAQQKRIPTLKHEIETYATLGSAPMRELSPTETYESNAAYETLRIAFDETVKADIGGVVSYVDGFAKRAQGITQ